jgi:putative molybdopterin biosynthesis protein
VGAAMYKRRYYLEDIALDEAYRRLEQALAEHGGLQPLPGERVPVAEALGRVTAEPVWAAISSPHYHAAAMDGVAVRAADTHGATETNPKRLKLGTQGIWVDTGDPLPPPFDAVIMAEHVQPVGEDEIEIRAPVAPWQHVRPLGEDIVQTELVLPENHLLRPVDLGAVAAAGHAWLVVRRRPRVAIIPTGTELVPVEAVATRGLKPGEIIEFNSLMLAAQVREWGGEASRLPIVPDRRELLRDVLQQALHEHDIVVINAGSSAGTEDYTAPVIAELGKVHVHGVAIRPGHPVIIGIVQGKPVLGLPGYPVSAVLTAELFLRPLVYRLLGLVPPERPKLTATLTRKVLSPMGEDEFLRVSVGRVGERVVATPLTRGAGVIMSLVRADGLVRIPRFSEGEHAGAQVTVELLSPPEEIERTIVAIGSHDIALDLLASHLKRRAPGMRLSSANVGSLGGLAALKRGEAHLAGSHLLDEESGEYTWPYVRRLLPGEDVVLVHLAWRQQGLLVLKGNPKRIERLEDLARPDVRFVNRQRGSGTRVLLDYHLRRLGIDPAQIQGYEHEEYTHLAVAAAVASGNADVGLGILAAARALGLDFVPVAAERYDLVMLRRDYEGELLRPLLETLRSAEYRRAVEALGGYDVSHMGELVPPP